MLPVVAIVGRPNVGKSSLLNAIAGERVSIVAPVAGVTRDRVSIVVERGGRRFEVVDTGGIGVVDSDRLEASTSEPGARRTFTDPALIAGGGVDIFLSRRVSVRPQGEAMFVLHSGDTRVMPAFTLHLAFHFEDHPITSSRK